MKKILLVSFLAAALGASTSALAQVAGPAGGTPQTPAAGNRAAKGDRKAMMKMNEEILAKLNLTDDQKAKFKAHDEEMKAKLLELRKGVKGAKGTGQSEDVKEKVKALRKENQEFMKQTLTKDQLKQYMQLRREAMKGLQSAGGTPVKP